MAYIWKRWKLSSLQVWFCCIFFMLIHTLCLITTCLKTLVCMNSDSLEIYLGNWGLDANVFPHRKFVFISAQQLITTNSESPEPHFRLKGYFLRHTVMTYHFQVSRGPRLRHGQLHCLFLLAGIILVPCFYFYPLRISPLCCVHANPTSPLTIQISASILCTLVGQQGLADITRQTLASTRFSGVELSPCFWSFSFFSWQHCHAFKKKKCILYFFQHFKYFILGEFLQTAIAGNRLQSSLSICVGLASVQPKDTKICGCSSPLYKMI